MGTYGRWIARLRRAVRAPRTVSALLVVCLLLGIALTIVTLVPEITLRETRHHEGQVPPLAEGQNALVVPGAAYEGTAFVEATTPGLECGVSIIFVTEPEWREFLETGDLPAPHLYCGQPRSRIAGSIAAVLVENQRAAPFNWSFDVALYDAAYPYAVYGLPAIALLLVGGVSLPVLLFQKVVSGWIEDQIGREKK